MAEAGARLSVDCPIHISEDVSAWFDDPDTRFQLSAVIDRRRNVKRKGAMDPQTFTHWYAAGGIGSDSRNRFLILFKDGVYVAVDLLMIYFGSAGWVRPSTWCEYDDLNVAVTTTIIRGAGF